MDYEAFANALLIVVTGLLTFFGVRKGIKGQSADGDKSEPFKLDMAMVDNEKIKALAGSVEALNNTMMETNKLLSKDIHDREIREEVARQIKDRQ